MLSIRFITSDQWKRAYCSLYEPPQSFSERADQWSWYCQNSSVKNKYYCDLCCRRLCLNRTGVERLVDEAIECGLRLAIATTTSLQNVEVILSGSLGQYVVKIWGDRCRRDVVKNKKPAGDIYQYVLGELRLAASACIVFEDSAIGCFS